MTNKELKQLKRIDLVDMLIEQDKEIETLRAALTEAEERAVQAEERAEKLEARSDQLEERFDQLESLIKELGEQARAATRERKPLFQRITGMTGKPTADAGMELNSATIKLPQSAEKVTCGREKAGIGSTQALKTLRQFGKEKSLCVAEMLQQLMAKIRR